MVEIYGRLYDGCKRVLQGPDFDTGIEPELWVKRERADSDLSDEVEQPYSDSETSEPTFVVGEVVPTGSRTMTGTGSVRLQLKGTSADGHRHYVAIDRYRGHVIGVWNEVTGSSS